jgi:type IX secretion system PorP/SprF family membrane protein
MPATIRFLSLYLISFCMLGSFHALKAQNVFFTQYQQSPLLTNPALPATSDVMSASLLYRRESVGGGTTFATPLLSLTYPLYKRFEDTLGYRWAGIGATVLSDQAGANGLLRTSGLKIGFSYLWKLSDSSHHYISIGGQAGFFQRALNLNSLTTGSQWSGGGFDPTLPNGENIENAAVFFPTGDVGLQWRWDDSIRRPIASAGVALMQINQPNTSFIGGDDKLPMTLVANASFKAIEKYSVSLHPNARYIMAFNGPSQLNAGVGVFYHFNKEWDPDSLLYREATLGVNVWYNPDGVVTAGIQLEHQRYAFSFSYDFNMPSAEALSVPQNALEVQIGIRRDFGYKKRPIKRIVPQPDTLLVEQNLPDSLKDLAPRFLRLDAELVYAKREDVELAEAEYNLLLRSILFHFGETELSPGSRLFLDRLTTILSANPDLKLEIAGYTCNTGDRRTNVKVSEARALAVWSYFVKAGISPDRLLLRGWGDLNPVADNATESGRIRNRRVQLRLVKEMPGPEAFRAEGEEADLPEEQPDIEAVPIDDMPIDDVPIDDVPIDDIPIEDLPEEDQPEEPDSE